MAGRPDFIHVRAPSQASAVRSIKSPRLHVAGEAPPEYSPLDAFAMQSRLLAKQLEESARQGRRMSRLPPLTIKSPLMVQGRSEYFRSMAQDDSDDADLAPPFMNPGLALSPEVTGDGVERPVSIHPRMSEIPPTPHDPIPLPEKPTSDLDTGQATPYEGLEVGREASVMAMESRISSDARHDPALTRPESLLQNSPDLPAQSYETSSSEKAKQTSLDGNLVPPRTLLPKRTSSIISSPLDGTDEDAASSLATSFHSLPAGTRDISGASSLPSPAFPCRRSPSVCSDMSILPRPRLNFSRPLSRGGFDKMPGLEIPIRQASSDSHTSSFIFVDDTASTPISINGDGFPDGYPDDGRAGAAPYLHSSYSLPRGKALRRNSALLLDGNTNPQLAPPGTAFSQAVGQPPPSPPTRPSSSTGLRSDPIHQHQCSERSTLSMEVLRPGRQPSRKASCPSTDGMRSWEDVPRGRPLTSAAHDTVGGQTVMSVNTSDSDSTIKAPRSAPLAAPMASDMTPEDHVAKAIALHEAGSFKESTWHLRLAARQNHPTGMLLYALACRHGWGMRPNQKEGVEWLRKAAESASLEIADDEGQAKEGKTVDLVERKTRKAQFALSIYELGVSHMNGWGIEQDKALALRCFEIAGSWGDVDALTEAGFCYAQGIGCKKNLKKSAKFYREAEAKGMSMVGNSWIHKSKYDDGKDAAAKKAGSKSRTRKSLFGRKSSTTT